MINYTEYFKGKKITMLGLGLLGRGLNDAKFLAECGAELTVTDLKTEKELMPTLKKLAKYSKPSYKNPGIKYVLGGHKLEDFRDRDFILKSAGVPLHSVYIEEARKNNIPVEMDESLFAKLAPEVKVIGVTGTRGKTTTTYLIYEILKAAFGKRVHLGGNIKGLATLPLLKVVKPGDMVVAELSSWQLQGFGEAGISPQISVFTNLLPDHLNYYLKGSLDEAEATQKYFMDKALIFSNQKEGDYLILDKEIKKVIDERYKGEIKSKVVMIGSSTLNVATTCQVDNLIKWKLKIKGEHNTKHILRAIEVAKILGVDMKVAKKAVENFRGVPGRQEFIREYKGIKIYNDTTATTPDATITALRALSPSTALGIKSRKIVLILGGADKNLGMADLMKEIPKYCKEVVLLSGTGTENLKKTFSKQTKDFVEFNNLKDAVKEGIKKCKKGDTLVLSPAFASFGMFKNEFDRGDQFDKIVKKLK